VFNKLFTKILDSSIWLEPTSTRIVWITLLAAMDETGYAHFSAMENLASRARVTMDEAEIAVKCLLAPDENSGDPENDGRRIDRVPGGFLILNAEKHRGILNRVIRNEQARLRVAQWRAKKNGHPIPQSKAEDLTPIISADADQPTRDMALKWVQDSRGLGSDYSDKEAVEAWLFYEGNGWMVSKHHKVADYRAALETRINNRREWAVKEANGTTRNTIGKPNPRNAGIIKGPSDLVAAVKRKFHESGVAKQVAENENQPPSPTGGY